MRRLTYLTLILLGGVFFTCTEEIVTPRNYPRLITKPTSSISSSGALFNAEVTYSNTDVLDHGFVWNSRGNPTLSNSESVSLGPLTGVGVFSENIDRALETSRVYYVRAYAKTTENTVYGNIVEFVSLGSKAPVIVDFYPKTGLWGDTISVIGRYFSQIKDNNDISFGQISFVPFFANDTLVKFIVPYNFINSTGKIKISVVGNTTESVEQFLLAAAELSDFAPDSANYGVKIELHGENFSKFYTKVLIGDKEASVLEVDETLGRLVALVPKGTAKGFNEVKIVIGDRSYTAGKKFFRASPQLKWISPIHVSYKNTVTIAGNFFAPEPSDNNVVFSSYPNEGYVASGKVLQSSDSLLIVEVPDEYISYTPKVSVTTNFEKSNELALTITLPTISNSSPIAGNLPGDRVSVFGENLPRGVEYSMLFNDRPVETTDVEVIDNQQLRLTFPDDLSDHIVALTIQVEDYEVGSVQLSTPYVKLTNASRGLDNFIFEENDEIYFLGKSNGGSFWKYGLATDSWIELDPVTSNESLRNIFSFHTDGVVFAGGGNWITSSREFYKYSMPSAKWEQIGDLPIEGVAVAYYSVDNSGFVLWAVYNGRDFTGKFELWKFDLLSEKWSFASSFNHENDVFPTSALFFSTDDELLYTFSYNEELTQPEPLWRFDLALNEWTSTSMDLLYELQQVTYGGNLYVIGLDYNTSDVRSYKYDSGSGRLRSASFPDLPLNFLLEKKTLEYNEGFFLLNEESIWKYDPRY